MKTKTIIRTSGMIAFFAAISFGISPLSAEILFADDFNRTNSSTVGYTSTGNYQWIENENNSQSFTFWINNNQLTLNGGGGETPIKSGNIYVDYDLDAISAYKIDFVITSGIGQFAYSGYTAIQPRGSGTFYAESWFFRANPTTSQVSLFYYDGKNETLVSSDVFATNTATSVSITVVDNIATLTVTGTSISDTRTLSTKANDGTPDYLGFSIASYGRSAIDNLTLTVIPEPSTSAALIAVGILAISSISMFRKR
jgi:hypothetical protein